jgi:hypothetical protein
VIGWAIGKRSKLQAPISAYIEDSLLHSVANDDAGVVLDILESGVFTNYEIMNPNTSTEVRSIQVDSLKLKHRNHRKDGLRFI